MLPIIKLLIKLTILIVTVTVLIVSYKAIINSEGEEEEKEEEEKGEEEGEEKEGKWKYGIWSSIDNPNVSPSIKLFPVLSGDKWLMTLTKEPGSNIIEELDFVVTTTNEEYTKLESQQNQTLDTGVVVPLCTMVINNIKEGVVNILVTVYIENVKHEVLVANIPGTIKSLKANQEISTGIIYTASPYSEWEFNFKRQYNML